MKFFRKTFSVAALAATFAAGAPVMARPAVHQPPVNSQDESEWPAPTLISSGDVAPSSWAITQRLDMWTALSGVGFPMAGVLQRMATPDALERDEHNMAVRHVASASPSPAVRETVAQDASSTDSEPSARASVAPAADEGNSATSSPSAASSAPASSSQQNVDSSAASSATSPAVAAPPVAPPHAKSSSTAPATSTRKAPVSVAGTPHRSSAVGSDVTSSSAIVSGATAPGAVAPGKVVMPKAPVVSAGSKKVGVTKVPSAKAAPRRDPARLSARRKDRILLARLEADLMRANRGLDRANDTLSRGQKQLMQMGSTLRTAMLEAGPEARGLHPFVRVAMRYAGTPYVWGGESRNGFDCSGFIIVVMRDLGYRALPHSAAEQFNYGTPIAQELLKPGDIVFFKNTYKPGVSHVGIYLGNRRFINAAGTGKGTIVSSLDEPKWQAHYAGARRLIRS